MITVTITAADNQAFVNRVVSRGDFASPDDYVNALIAEDRIRGRKKKLEQLLLEGLEGESIEADGAFWDDMFRRFDERHPAQSSSP